MSWNYERDCMHSRSIIDTLIDPAERRDWKVELGMEGRSVGKTRVDDEGVSFGRGGPIMHKRGKKHATIKLIISRASESHKASLLLRLHVIRPYFARTAGIEPAYPTSKELECRVFTALKSVAGSGGDYANEKRCYRGIFCADGVMGSERLALLPAMIPQVALKGAWDRACHLVDDMCLLPIDLKDYVGLQVDMKASIRAHASELLATTWIP
ncbi:hypothetical protein BDN71DRAFT_1493498 [Pleurotus eryngii]|uniref:Uncharacterized protein n=1 Tax=Pleurotus eryngii TaxID=5323 RepID=A0A9P6A7X8_PLEER|nr:hypothetical protein BDN71DRAFT_1493498 [Pleurotus eryngii]